MKALLALAFCATIAPALADSTIDNTNKHAYAANGGWINLGNGTPSNGHTYSQSSGEFGVHHDGGGILTGYAYGSNIGWINFDWKAGNEPNEPKINLATGKFSGFAYGTNVGWIKLDAAAGAILETDSLQCPDVDNDDIADWWERQNAGNLPRYNASSDRDEDGVSDKDEYFALTDPEDPLSYMKATGSYSAGGTTFTISFPSDPGRRYAVLTGTDLISWPDSGLGTFSPDSGTSTTKIITIPGSNSEAHRFFRVVAKKPLQP